MSRQQRVVELYRRAAELDPAEVAELLDRECGGDDEVRSAVEALLAAQGETIDVPGSGVPPNVAGRRARRHANRFSAGEVFADRYRIVSLLGRGAMGEVYRAHDTVLDVEVAIKLIAASARPELRERLLQEVRLAREITHPAVVRVFDVGREGDLLFFTMEYVDGEDMASLLGRIGRLPSDKVVEIAQQICGGLAAAHARGVVHRDLKPANLMIDSRGKVRITDFGIAVAEDETGRSEFAGTPAYMAPEQLTPEGVVGSSADIYATGLILYELLTGRKVFDAPTLTGMLQQKMRREPEPPSTVVDGVDPRLERAILHALAKSPELRPSSALAMAAELPGGDPLALAVEAGATPAPSLVAAAVDRPFGRSAPWILGGLLLAALAMVLSAADPAAVVGESERILPPEVLADRADRMLGELGLDDRGAQRDWGFLDDVAAADPAGRVLFWYREWLPRPLPSFVEQIFESSAAVGDIDIPDIHLREPLFVLLEPSGDLVYFSAGAAFGSKVGGASADHESYDWSALLEMAGLAGADLVPDREAVIPVFADRRAAWIQADPERPGEHVTVQAAAFEGRPVYFAKDARDGGSKKRIDQLRRRAWLDRYVRNPLYLVVVLTALGMGVRAVARERSDLRGAAVVAGTVLTVELLASLLALGHVAHPLASARLTAVARLLEVVAAALAAGLIYLGLEPVARRHRPRALIAWSRLVGGVLLDRAVGTSLAVGAVAGSLWAAIAEADRILVSWLGLDASWSTLGADRLNAVVGMGQLLATALRRLDDALVAALLSLVLLAVLGRWLRPRWLVPAVFVAVVAIVEGIDGGAHLPLSVLTQGVAVGLLCLYLLERFGLLAFAVGGLCAGLLSAYPMTLMGRVWFADGGFFAVGLVLLIGIAGVGMMIRGRSRGGPARSSDAVHVAG